MGVRLWLPAALAAMLCVSGPARADGETPFETVAGYQVNRVEKPGEAFPCRMVRGYEDPNDADAANALGFGQMQGFLLVSLVYERWKWQEGKFYKASLSVDNVLIDSNAQWLGNGTNLAIRVPDSYLPTFNAGKRIVLGFKDGNADFDLTGFKPAFESVQRCNRLAKSGEAKSGDAKSGGIGSSVAAAPSPAASPTPAPASPATPVPSEDRAVAYLFALYDRWAFDACDFATTAKQRQALDAKAAALKPEMSAIEPDLTKAVQGDPDRCPPTAVLQKQLQLLLDNEPEAFVAKLDERTRGEFQGIVRPILARLRPPAPAEPSQARMSAYLWGLVMRDKLAQCDIASTAKQRTGLEGKLADMQSDMAPYEAALRAEIKGKLDDCPRAEKAAEMISMLNLFIERSPEDFVAEMDRRSAASNEAGAGKP